MSRSEPDKEVTFGRARFASRRAARADRCAIPATPPADVAQALEGAAYAYERLAAKGHELRFECDAHTRRVVVQMHDAQGNAIRQVEPSELFGMLSEGEQ